ncbi:MAG TPA: pyridoxamine 5'-phosphate oxidase family protein [Candidatus Dormibacteraeota bacterium]
MRTFLREQRFCALATTSPGGDPHLVPVGFLYLDDTSFWLPTGAGAVRLADLRKRPRAALMVGQGVGAQHQLVLVRGPVRIHPGQDLRGVVAKAAGEKLGDTDWASSWLELRPTSVLAYSG